MYELLKRIDFSKRRNNPEKDELKRKFIKWLDSHYPEVNTVETYFTDAIFIANNSSLGLDIVEVISDEDEGITNYHKALIKHFESKGYDITAVLDKT